jgi:hypothetical protein
MMTHMRTIIELPDDQVHALEGICRRQRISRAEAIRRAVALLVQQHGDEHRAFGVWRDRREDSLAYERRLRSEWDAPVMGRKRR